MNIFKKLFAGNRFSKRFDNAVDMVKHGVYNCLKATYALKYKESKAAFLAAAVTNGLFSEPPGNAEGREFLDRNTELVKKKINEIKNNDEIRKIVSDTLTVRKQFICRFQKSGDYDKKPGVPIENLKKKGVYLQSDKTPSPKQFISIAKRFYASSLKR